MKKTLGLLSLLATCLFVTNAFATSVDFIFPINDKNVDVTISSDVVFPNSKVSGDVKILKDLVVTNVERDANDAKKVNLYLLENLAPNSNYSIVSVWDAEWSIEFSLWNDTSWDFTNFNSSGEKSIERIFVQDTLIEVYYNYDVPLWGTYDFKVLEELQVEDLSSVWNNVLNVKLKTPLEGLNNYIFMVSSLLDAQWNPLSFEETLYDFYTNSDLLKVEEEPSYLEDIELTEDLNSGNTNIENSNGTTNLEEIALNSNKTPQTGPAEIWVIFVVTLLLTWFLFMRRKEA